MLAWIYGGLDGRPQTTIEIDKVEAGSSICKAGRYRTKNTVIGICSKAGIGKIIGRQGLEKRNGAQDAARIRRHVHRHHHDGDRLAGTFDTCFFAAVVKKKLNLNLVSRKVGGDRVYRIEKTTPAA